MFREGIVVEGVCRGEGLGEVCSGGGGGGVRNYCQELS